MQKNKQPLYMPKGSVRAIFFLIFSVFIFFCLFRQIALPEYIILTWSGLIGLYFGSRLEFKNKNQDE